MKTIVTVLIVCFFAVIFVSARMAAAEDVVTTDAAQASVPEDVVTTSAAQTTLSEDVVVTAPPQSLPRETVQPAQDGFWTSVGTGIKKGGSYTWQGMKWTGKKIERGAYYMKEGAVSFGDSIGQSTGLKERDSEEEFTDNIIQKSNQTLVESKTKREIRKEHDDKLNQSLKKYNVQ
jgi:hypothetical protein